MNLIWAWFSQTCEVNLSALAIQNEFGRSEVNLSFSSTPNSCKVEELLNKFHARVKSRVQKDMNAQKTSQAKGQRSTSPTTTCTNSLGVVPQAHEDDEVCPICLLEMVEGESLTSCQDGCHNRLHQHCMEICKLGSNSQMNWMNVKVYKFQICIKAKMKKTNWNLDMDV